MSSWLFKVFSKVKLGNWQERRVWVWVGSLNEGMNSEELLFMSSSFAEKHEVFRTIGL